MRVSRTCTLLQSGDRQLISCHSQPSVCDMGSAGSLFERPLAQAIWCGLMRPVKSYLTTAQGKFFQFVCKASVAELHIDSCGPASLHKPKSLWPKLHLGVNSVGGARRSNASNAEH